MSFIGNPLVSMNYPVDYFTGDGSTNIFTLSNIPASTSSIIVSVNGTKLVSSSSNPGYFLDGSTLTISNTPPLNATIEVVYLGVLSQVNVPADLSITGNQLSSNLSLSGTTTIDNLTVSGDVIISGNAVVQGTTTTFNVDTLTIEDKNVVLANVAIPNNITADGAGITVLGATNKTWNWVNTSSSWTSSENIDLASGKSFKINGTDVLTGSSLGSGVTGSSLTSVGTLSSLTVSGNTTLGDAAGDTLTINAGTTTFAQGTANGVLYLNGSKVATSGSGLVFDGTNLGVGTATPTFTAGGGIQAKNASFVSFRATGGASTGIDFAQASDGKGYIFNRDNADILFGLNNAEQMRLTSTGLGIGTSSPGAKLDVANSGVSQIAIRNTSGTTKNTQLIYADSTGNKWQVGMDVATNNGSTTFQWYYAPNATSYLNLDSSGNLGLGVTPSAWGSAFKVVELGKSGSSLFTNSANGNLSFASNAYVNSSGALTYANNGYAGQFQSSVVSGGFLWNIATSGTAGNAITFTQAMTLDASGNLGIGASSPNAKLKVALTSSAATPIVNVASFGAAGSVSLGSITNNSEGVYLGTGDAVGGGIACGFGFLREASGWNSALAFYTNNVTAGPNGVSAIQEKMRIDSSGNLLIGVTTTGTSNSNSITLNPSIGAISYNHLSGTASGSFFAGFGYNGNLIGSITQNGTTNVLYNTSSDQRLKTNITPAGSAIQSILDFPVDQFDWIADGSHVEFGAVAQKAINVIPEMVSVPANEDEMWGIDWSKAVPRLIKTIQELNEKYESTIQELTQRIQQLESK